MLQDSALISSHIGSVDSTLTLMIIVSLDTVNQILESGVVQRQLSALEDLGKLGLRGGRAAIIAASARLEDADFNVRQAAVEALGQLAEKGDQPTITAVSARLED